MKSVVLLSSGLDSTVNLAEAVRQSDVVLALTFDYGQRAAERERERSQAICGRLGVRHQIVELPFFSLFTRTSLVNKSADVPTGDAVSIDDRVTSERSARSVWVPNRNGVFLAIGAAFAEGEGANWVVPGFNAEEAATFPDNSREFLDATSAAFRYSTANGTEAKCFTTGMTKPEIVRRGIEIGAPLDLAWPCYFGGKAPCGSCESCRRFARALREGGAPFPADFPAEAAGERER